LREVGESTIDRYNGLILSCLTPLHDRLPFSLARTSVCLGCLWLSACAVIDDPVANAMRKVTPYRIEVVQGNFVSKEQVAALRPGMTRNQVKEILGTPLIASVFHADRWDYAFTIRRKGTAPQQRKLSVFFQNDQFISVQSDELPSESEFAERLSTAEDRQKVPRLTATPQELESFKGKTPSPAPASEPAASAERRTYPPLEASPR